MSKTPCGQIFAGSSPYQWLNQAFVEHVDYHFMCLSKMLSYKMRKKPYINR